MTTETTSKSADFSSVALRLHLVEEKVKHGSAPDLADVIEGLNRLYEMTMRGSQYTTASIPLAYNQEDGTFWYDDPTHGAIGTETGKSLFDTILGTQDNAEKTADRSFWEQTFGSGSAHWSEIEAGEWTLAHAVFKTPATFTSFVAGGSMVDQLMTAQAEINTLKARLAAAGIP